MRMDSTDLTIHESEDEDVYDSVEKNIEITKHGKCEGESLQGSNYSPYSPSIINLKRKV